MNKADPIGLQFPRKFSGVCAKDLFLCMDQAIKAKDKIHRAVIDHI